MKNIVAKFYIIGLVFAVGVPLQSIAADWTDADDSTITYTALKSIKGGGSAPAYINTGIVPNGTETVKFKFKPTDVRTSSNDAIFCSRDSSAAQQFAGFKIGSKIRIDRNSTQSTCNSPALSANSDYSVVANYSAGTISINGTFATLNNALGTGDYRPTADLYLYASHKGGESVSNKGWYWLYYFQMYSSGGVLQHNFMPAKRDIDNVIGVYDTVQRKFYAPTGGSFANSTARTVIVPSGCKKWTGLGGADNKMSTGANWEGGVAPQAGDDLDFTLAAPLAEINADMNVTFGKVWIDDGDLPGFTNTLTATAINDPERMQVYDTATEAFTFMLASQDFTWNGGAAANWSTTDSSWLCNSAASVWYDYNNAILNTADATVTLTEDVRANSLVFNQNATVTVDGTATLTVPTVSVAADVSATISAPTAGALEKIGAGTLTLGSSRTDQTTLSEGTLKMASGATLDLAKLTLGTNPAKPVSLDLGGATINADLTSRMSATVGGAAGGSVAIDNGAITNTATLRVGNGSLTLGSDAHVTMNASDERWVCVGGINSANEGLDTIDASLVLDGTSINKSGTENVFLAIGDFGSYPSKATMIVKNGGKSEIGDTVYVAQGCEGHLVIDGEGSSVTAYQLVFCNAARCAQGENGYVVVTNGGTLVVNRLRYGSGAGEGYFRFDGGTLLATAAVTLLPAHEKLHYIVGEKGGTIDNGGNNITIAKGLSGTGTINLTGSGMTTFAAGVGTECGVSVASGTTLALNGSVTFAGPVVFESGSTLSVTAPSCDKAALAAPSISIKGDMIISIPFQRFADGKYKILEMSDAQFGADVLNCLTLNGGKGDELKKYALSVEGNTIYLEVTGGVESYWVGGVGDNRFSVAANWDNGKVPEDGATLDFSGVASKTQINADVDKVYNTILIPVPSGNSFWDYYVQVSGTLHLNTITNATFLSVAADSVLKVDGDVVLNKDAKKLGSTSSKRGCYMFHSNKGRIEIGGNLVNEVTPNNRVLMYISSSPGGVLKMGGVVNNSDKAISLCGNHTTPILCVIGENGLSGKMGFYQYGGSNAEITLKAGDDFAVGIYLTASYPFKFDTSDETETAHTIILDAEINGSGGVTIVGNGRVVANSSADPGTNVVTVEGGATLAINPGKLITNGKMTVNSGATLSLPQSGAVTLGGDLELADGSTLAFNFTERKVGPLLALASEKSLSFVGEGEKNIAVKVSGDVWPVGGKHILTATGGFKAEGVTVSLAAGSPKWAKGVYVNEDGNIVLDVKPMGTRVIVR